MSQFFTVSEKFKVLGVVRADDEAAAVEEFLRSQNYDGDPSTLRAQVATAVHTDPLLAHRGEFSGANQAVAVGRRYGPDGWSEEKSLFRFHPRGGAPLMAQADDLRVHGVGGAARHGCEEVTSVRSLG